MHLEIDKYDSVLRGVGEQLTTSAQKPTCVIARALRACVYAIRGALEFVHGTLFMLCIE